MINFCINKVKGNAPIYVLGHRKPDVDTAVSSYLLSNILNKLGIEAYPCILNEGYEFDEYNNNIIKDFFDYNPVVINIKDINKYNFILVDHNDPIQSLKENINIIWCFDHHKNSNQINNLTIGKYCANSLFIYDYFKDMYEFNDKEKTLILMAVFTDTLFLKSDRFTDNDKKIINGLGVNLDSELLLRKYFIETDLSKGIKNYLKKSDRDFCYYGINFTSSVIQLINCNLDIINEYENAIKEKDENHLGLLRDLSNNITYAFFKVNDNLKKLKYNRIVSRQTILSDVILKLEENK